MTNLDEPSPFVQHSVKRMMCTVTSKYARLFKISTLGLLLGVFYFAQTGGMVQAGDKESLTEDESSYNLCVLKGDLESVITDDIGLLTPPPIHAQETCLPQEQKQINEQEIFQQELELLLAGHPMEAMAESIALQDRTVAAFLVGIAKKESNWGKHSPSKGGQDCFNYWGYKTSGTRGQSMGYACFGSVEEAVDVTGSRISHFVHETNRRTPAQMVVIWKCGSSCATHAPGSVSKWIADVQIYYNKVLAIETTQQNPQTILTLR